MYLLRSFPSPMVFSAVAFILVLSTAVRFVVTAAENKASTTQSMTYEQPLDLIKAGNRIWFGVEKLTWSTSDTTPLYQVEIPSAQLIITEVSGDNFKGVIREDRYQRIGSDSPQPILQRVDGKIAGEQYQFQVQEYDLESDLYQTNWLGESTETQTFLYRRPDRDDPSSEYRGTIRHTDTLSEADIRRLLEDNEKRFAAGKEEWGKLKSEIERLRARGHRGISVKGLLDNGHVHFEWTDSPWDQETIKDLSLLRDLESIPYIHELRINGKFTDADVQYLRGLHHIRKLPLARVTATSLADLGTGPRIDGLIVRPATPSLARSLSRLKTLKWITLNFIGTWERSSGDCLTPVAHLPHLEELVLYGVPAEQRLVKNALKGARGLKSLEISEGDFDRDWITALTAFPELTELRVPAIEREDLGLIRHPKLQRLHIRSSFGATLADLAGMDLPNLERLRVPFWVPGDAAQYVQRLPEMTPEEQACYQAANATREISQNIYDSKKLAERAAVHVTTLIGQQQLQTDPQFARRIHEILNDAREAKELEQTKLPELAVQAQKDAARLASEKIMPLKNAVDVQALTYKYSGVWQPELKKHFTEKQIKEIESKREAYVKQSRRR